MIPGIVTGVLLVVFVVGMGWAWSPKRKREFDSAAQLALDDAPSAKAGKDRG